MRIPRRAADGSNHIGLVAERYVTWRNESAAVAESYRRWSRAVGEERAVGYVGYLAALDREEHAAAAYRRLIDPSQAH